MAGGGEYITSINKHQQFKVRINNARQRMNSSNTRVGEVNTWPVMSSSNTRQGSRSNNIRQGTNVRQNNKKQNTMQHKKLNVNS
jgi:hypothetical protein